MVRMIPWRGDELPAQFLLHENAVTVLMGRPERCWPAWSPVWCLSPQPVFRSSELPVRLAANGVPERPRSRGADPGLVGSSSHQPSWARPLPSAGGMRSHLTAAGRRVVDIGACQCLKIFAV